MKHLLILISFLLLSSPVIGQSVEKCYVVVDSSEDIDPSLLSNISISLISKFLRNVESIPVSGISMDTCQYKVSVSKKDETTFITFNGEGLNSYGDSKLSGSDGFQQSLLKSLYRSLKDKRKIICEDYGTLLEECNEVVVEVVKRQNGVLFGIRDKKWNEKGEWKWNENDDDNRYGRYKGEIEDGVPNGQGKLVTIEGKSIVGEWKNGKEWNTEHTNKIGTLLGKFENGNWELMWGILYWEDESVIRILVWRMKELGIFHEENIMIKRKEELKEIYENDDLICKNRKYLEELRYKRDGGYDECHFEDACNEGGLKYGMVIKGKERCLRFQLEDIESTTGKFQGKITNLKPNGKGTLKWFDGKKYEGEWKEGMFHGQGIYTWSKWSSFLDKYEGEWKEGMFHGQGTLTWSEGGKKLKYLGGFKEGMYHGQGTITDTDRYLNKNTYVGEFKKSKRNGKGIATRWNGETYIGEYKDGKKHGKGTYNFKDGRKYEGEWKEGMFHGQGTETCPNGRKSFGEWKNGRGWNGKNLFCSFEGEWKDGLRNGKNTTTYQDYSTGGYAGKQVTTYKDGVLLPIVTHIWNNGDKYVGELKRKATSLGCMMGFCSRNGQGTQTWKNGDKYIGEWKDNKKDGQGTFTFKDGSTYVGEFKDGKKHGQGIFTNPDGDKYVGEWKNGEHNGQGTWTTNEGEKYVGEWKNAEPNGQGTFTYPDGRKYVGEVKDGKYHGQGTLTYPSGFKTEGEFRYGKIWNGYGFETHFNDKGSYIGGWKNGKRNGQGTFTSRDGRKFVGEFKNGEYWNIIGYDKNGNIIIKVVNGKLE